MGATPHSTAPCRIYIRIQGLHSKLVSMDTYQPCRNMHNSHDIHTKPVSNLRTFVRCSRVGGVRSLCSSLSSHCSQGLLHLAPVQRRLLKHAHSTPSYNNIRQHKVDHNVCVHHTDEYIDLCTTQDLLPRRKISSKLNNDST